MLTPKREGGWTLIELLMALVLALLVTGSVYRLAVGHRQAFRRQVQRVDLQSNLRMALAMLPPELIELHSADPLGSDLVLMGDSLLTYKAMRTLWFVCQTPRDDGASGRVILWRSLAFGSRQLDGARDSLFLYAVPDTAERSTDYWVHANVVSVEPSTDCPSSRAGFSVTLDGIRPVGSLAAVRVGAPARGVELMQLTTYRDRYRDRWIGVRQFNKGSGWGRIQPILGPIEAGGLRFSYFDETDSRTTTPQQVAQIAMTVVGRSTQRVRTWSGGVQHLRDTLVTRVALRGRNE